MHLISCARVTLVSCIMGVAVHKECSGLWLLFIMSLSTGGCIRRAETDLGCDVIRGAAERAGGHAFMYALLAHAKVCQLTMTVFVEENVVQLEIPEKRDGKTKTEPINAGTFPSSRHKDINI